MSKRKPKEFVLYDRAYRRYVEYRNITQKDFIVTLAWTHLALVSLPNIYSYTLRYVHPVSHNNRTVEKHRPILST